MAARRAGRDGLVAQYLPGWRIPEEARHADQQFADQQLLLLLVFLEIAEIGRGLRDLLQRHPACHAALDGALLVLGKVAATPGAEKEDDLVECVPPLSNPASARSLARSERRRERIGDARADPAQGRRRRRAEYRWRFGACCRTSPSRVPARAPGLRLLLHRPDPERPVRSHPRENHRDGVGTLSSSASERKNPVDREPQTAMGETGSLSGAHRGRWTGPCWAG